MTIVEIILQEICLQVVMASEMKVHQEDSIVDPQEEVASEIEEASGIEAASEVVVIEIRKNKESSRKASALIANNKVIWPEIALSRETKTVREEEVVATSQESQEVT